MRKHHTLRLIAVLNHDRLITHDIPPPLIKIKKNPKNKFKKKPKKKPTQKSKRKKTSNKHKCAISIVSENKINWGGIKETCSR